MTKSIVRKILLISLFISIVGKSQAQSIALDIRSDFILSSGPRISLGIARIGDRFNHTALVGFDKPKNFSDRANVGLGYSIACMINDKFGLEASEFLRFGSFRVSTAPGGPGGSYCTGPILFEHGISLVTSLKITSRLNLNPKLGFVYQHGYEGDYEGIDLPPTRCNYIIVNSSWLTPQLNLQYEIK